MKTKIILSTLLLGSTVFGQQTMSTTTVTTTSTTMADGYYLSPTSRPFNHFSMDAQFGLNYAQGPIAPGYSTNEFGLYHLGLGGRYMFNNKVGLRLGLNYDAITEGFDGPNFHTDYFRTSLEGVINLATLLDFNTRFGLLLHGGGGYSLMTGVNMMDDFDHIMNLTGGITPQVMLSNRMSIYADISATSNVYQDYTYDFARVHTNRGFDGNIFNFSVGLQYNFGSKDLPYADYVYDREVDADAIYRDMQAIRTDVSQTQSDVAEIERDMQDADGDGVANYLDQEANTPAGVMVDTKGRGIIWYNVYQELDEFDNNTTTDWTGYLNRNEVLFETESAAIDAKYNRTLNNMAIVLINNPSYKLSVVGHADDRGDNPFNLDLSKNRAEAVKTYLVSKGVDESRIIASGVGEVQPQGNKDIKIERKHNRRVEFITTTK